MRTLEELEARINKHAEDSTERLFIQMCGGFHPLMDWSPTWLKEEYTPEPLTEEAVIKEMQNYIDFALRKANNERGISSNRSVWKYVQWLWLLEDDELFSFARDDSNYPMYGMPILKKIIEKYNLKVDE